MIQSLRILVETRVLEEDWAKARYEKLALIGEKRARAEYHAQGYQKRFDKAFNKKMKPRNLKEGDHFSSKDCKKALMRTF